MSIEYDVEFTATWNERYISGNTNVRTKIFTKTFQPELH